MLLDSYLVLWVSSFVTCLTCRNSVYQTFSLTSHDSSDSSQGLLVHAASSPLMDLTGKSLREVFPSPHTWLLMQSLLSCILGYPGHVWRWESIWINSEIVRMSLDGSERLAVDPILLWNLARWSSKREAKRNMEKQSFFDHHLNLVFLLFSCSIALLNLSIIFFQEKNALAAASRLRLGSGCTQRQSCR